jgi:hypothetical protein
MMRTKQHIVKKWDNDGLRKNNELIFNSMKMILMDLWYEERTMTLQQEYDEETEDISYAKAWEE